jgi:predicted dithiol-disulfide oxidoreductase (DUF899 family)
MRLTKLRERKMTQPDIVSKSEWLVARQRLLAEEKAFTRARDALSAKRRQMPAVRVEKAYRFRGPEGEMSLADLFGGSKQLIVQHFMYGPDWEEGCPSCSFWADGFNGLDAHLRHRDTALVAVARTPLEKFRAYGARMGWTLPMVSSLGSDFNFDFNVSFTSEALDKGETEYNYRKAAFPSEEAPGISVFLKRGDDILHTYSCYSRGLDMMNAAYHYLDLTPLGRHEDDLAWPMAWLKRHDQYES